MSFNTRRRRQSKLASGKFLTHLVRQAVAGLTVCPSCAKALDANHIVRCQSLRQSVRRADAQNAHAMARAVTVGD